MNFIKKYVEDKVASGMLGREIAIDLGISVMMVSQYKNWEYFPSIAVAKRVYTNEGIVLHPFSEESLKYEIN